MDQSSLFGTSGIRGDAQKFFTDQFCFDLGRTFAHFLTSHKIKGYIAIGMDPRGSSPRIKDALCSGLQHEGFEVCDQGATPVPSINYILKTGEKYAGSIMVSGSHIQPHLNGVKFFFLKEEIQKSHESQIEKIYARIKNEVDFVSVNKDVIEVEEKANLDYQEYLSNIADNPYPPWKIVVDPGDGAQSDTMPVLLKRLGIDVVEINATIQGTFLSRDTEREEDFRQLKEKVVLEKADLGVGYDSDGDRVIFFDEKGQFIPGDFSCTLVCTHLPGDKVVVPVNVSHLVDHIGKEVVRTKVGSPFVVEAMKKTGANFGFEGNGGGIFDDMLSRDGGRITVEMLNIMFKTGKKLSELIAQLPKYYICKDKVEYRWELKDTIIKQAKENFKAVKTDETDGLKLYEDDNSWVLFRSSQNAPEFRVFAESTQKAKAQKLLKEGIALVEKIVKEN